MPRKATTTTTTTTTTEASASYANSPEASAITAQHMALASQLAQLVALGAVRVPTSHRWLVGTAMWHTQGNIAEASALVASWCAAYGCMLPPASQYTTMQRWLGSNKHAIATGVSKPPRKVAVVATVAAEASAPVANA